MKFIQSLQRAFDILERVSDEPEACHALGDLAQATGLHPATCSHLVNTMVERGYLSRTGLRKGYQLGPMAYYLVRNGAYRRELVLRAEPLLQRLAEALGEWVVLTVMAGTRRLILLELNGARGAVQLDRRAVRLAERAYDSASIWLFLAHMAEADLARFIEWHGQPRQYRTREALAQRLAEIREAGFCIYEDEAGEVAKVSFPVLENGVVTAAVGVYLPAFRFKGAHREQILEQAATLAARISMAA